MSQCPVFALQKQPKYLNFKVPLSLIESSVATFKETCALTSRKYVFEQDMMISNLSEKPQIIWLHSFIFALQKQPKNLNF